MTIEFLPGCKTESADYDSLKKNNHLISQFSEHWLRAQSFNWSSERIYEGEDTWFSEGCALSSILA